MPWFVGGSGGLCWRGGIEELIVEDLLLGVAVCKVGEGGGLGCGCVQAVEVRLGRGQR